LKFPNALSFSSSIQRPAVTARRLAMLASGTPFSVYVNHLTCSGLSLVSAHVTSPQRRPLPPPLCGFDLCFLFFFLPFPLRFINNGRVSRMQSMPIYSSPGHPLFYILLQSSFPPMPPLQPLPLWFFFFLVQTCSVKKRGMYDDLLMRSTVEPALLFFDPRRRLFQFISLRLSSAPRFPFQQHKRETPSPDCP